MFNFTLVSQNGNIAIIKVQCFQHSIYNIEKLEVHFNGAWYTPTKDGLNTLIRSISDDKIRKNLITDLHKSFKI